MICFLSSTFSSFKSAIFCLLSIFVAKKKEERSPIPLNFPVESFLLVVSLGVKCHSLRILDPPQRPRVCSHRRAWLYMPLCCGIYPVPHTAQLSRCSHIGSITASLVLYAIQTNLSTGVWQIIFEKMWIIRCFRQKSSGNQYQNLLGESNDNVTCYYEIEACWQKFQEWQAQRETGQAEGKGHHRLHSCHVKPVISSQSNIISFSISEELPIPWLQQIYNPWAAVLSRNCFRSLQSGISMVRKM